MRHPHSPRRPCGRRSSRHRSAPKRLTVFAGLAAATALVACSESVAGDPTAAEAERDVGSELEEVESSSLRETFDQSEQEVNDYWTSDRINDAEPPSMPDGDSDVPQADPLEESVIVEPTEPATRDIAPDANGSHDGGEEWSYAGLSGDTVGRLYMSFPSGDMVCSATVVSSDSQVLVATAAHCVWDTEGSEGIPQNVMFVPGDQNGSGPHGRWVAESVFMPQEFQDNAHSTPGGVTGDGWAVDIAFLRMKPQDGDRIEQAVGAQGIAFSAEPNGLTVLGYPTAPPFDGTVMRYCSSPASDDRDTYGAYTIPCVMTPGCSGGPWLTRFDPDSGVGYLVSTTSRTNEVDLMASEYGEVAYDIYVAADENQM